MKIKKKSGDVIIAKERLLVNLDAWFTRNLAKTSKIKTLVIDVVDKDTTRQIVMLRDT